MAKAKKYSAFGGVFTPSILTLLGVIMYLRLPWIVGQAGLLATLSIILVAHIISGSTGLSVASIATDKKVETGGTYYIISRSLGLPIGGTLGWALFVGLSFSVSLYLIGFAEVFLGYFGFEVSLTTIRITGSIILLLVTILTFISTSLAIKTQYIILTIMALSLLSVFFGKHGYAPVAPQLNALPESLSWITLFAIFFPAVTGFEAGVSMSGDLKDPRKAIPVGTISAILVGLIVYVGLAVFFSYTVNNDLLVNDPNVLFKISLVPQLVIAGILGATLSSALGSIMGAPRIMQAVAKDRIAPFFFSKGFGASNEPRNALLLTFIIAETGILIGELNVIARIVTIFFIITYGFLNITYAVESWASSDFMPSFKIPRIVSIIGAVACIIVMIQLDVLALAVASLVLIALFFYLKNKELTLNAGDTRSSIWLSLVKTGLFKLAKNKINSRNWRPNIILFSGGVKNRPHLIEIGNALVGKRGIFTNFELIENPEENQLFDNTANVSVESFGEYGNIITRKYACKDIYDGIEMISKVYGFSGFEPNTILMGWGKNTRDPKKLKDLLITLNKLDYNLTLLSYDKENGFGKYKKIDFWWSGKGRNLSLALHLIRFITVTPKWRDAEIRILAINSDSKNTDRYYAILGQIIDNYRIRATIKVIHNYEKLPKKDIIRVESRDTDLTIAEIPEFAYNQSETVVRYANELTGSLKSSLFIHASSGFEEINVISESPIDGKEKKSVILGQKPVAAILDNLDLSKTDIIYNEVYNLAQILEKQAGNLIENTFFVVKESRDHFLDQLENLTIKTLNDYSYQVQKQLISFKENYLNNEREILLMGINSFLTETDNAINTLPQSIRLKFNKEDYKNLKSGNPIRWVNKAGKILWISVTGKRLSYKIGVQQAARYYLYTKILEYFRQFYDNYTADCLTAFGDIKEILSSNRELILKMQSGKFSHDEILVKGDEVAAIINKRRIDNQNFVYNQGNILIDELTVNLNDFSKIIENPQANFLSRKFRYFNKKSVILKNFLSEFPDLWFRFMVNHVNKTYLDSIYFAIKTQLALKIEKADRDFEVLIQENIYKKLQSFKNQINNRENGIVFNQEPVLLLKLEDIFNPLIKEIQEAVDALPESIEITVDNFTEYVPLEKLENINVFVVSIRKVADFYISNELIDQIKKQSLNIGQKLSLSTAAINNLIRLAKFNLDENENTSTDEAENEKRQEYLKIFIEGLLSNIYSEKNKLKELSGQLRSSLDIGLNNAFEPLSSAIIIKTSTGLTKKILNTDKRIFSKSLQEIQKSVRSVIINQLVKMIYSESEGLLWANRMEQSREKLLLCPGEPVKLMLEKISPDKTLMQNLPFYYSNLFSGSSSIGEDFWVGMDEEIEKGSNAIKRFLNGASGLLIISGERSSGKSSLSKHLANLHFKKQNTFNIRAPRESTADVSLFEQTLLKSLAGKDNLQYSMETLPPESTIIVNDLELWWERRPSGTQVIEKIISLMRQYGNKVLFIVNINQYALKIISQLSSINTWALDLVFCKPFDARELKSLIMVRHQAGGMKFILNKKHEDGMTNWDYARLFNRFFKLSSGNPGYAINLWLAGIRKISDKTLIMEKPFNKEITFSEDLPQNEMYYILQFILHRRFSVKKISEILQNDFEDTEKTIRILFQKGILVEKFPEVYCLNPALEIHLVKKLKNLGLL